jgi:fatty acid desaturase
MKLQFSSSTTNQLDPLGNNQGESEVCIANISPKERKKRLNFAIRQGVVAVVLLVALLYFDVNVLWRLPLFFVFAAAISSFFQWRDKT